jgi:hypothetical protein
MKGARSALLFVRPWQLAIHRVCRRRPVRAGAGSYLAVIFTLMTTATMQAVVAQPNNPVFRINAKTDKKDICAGCTTGGLACFGLNSCEAGCVEKQTYDCCGAFVGTGSACCPSCPGTCRPNLPCNVTGNSIDLDACPEVGNAPRGCRPYRLISGRER